MPGHDIIVIGASAGGVETITQLVGYLPADLPAALFVVIHIPAHSRSALPAILHRNGKLHAFHPEDGDPIQSGRIYIAPPNMHLLVKDGYIRLTHGPRENGHRPAIDPLFRTAARSYGRQVVGVVLSGTLDDGTAGLQAIKMRGGVTIVQSPEEAIYPGMPRSAIEHVQIDHVLSVAQIAEKLIALAHQPVYRENEETPSEEMEIEADMAELDPAALARHERPGTPSGFACPECGGALWEVHEDKLIRFRCRVGHAYSPETLLAHQSEALEDALWVALRALEERAALSARMADRSRERGQEHTTARFDTDSKDATARAEIVREVLLKIVAGREEPDS
jgi:two-component system, chemotaxis family, protein-glutamate methylesterase/glutaminase